MKRAKKVNGSLSHQAYLLIRDRILSGQIPFGASVSRRELSRELGMSTLPVTEALRRLESEKLIEAVPRVGTVVRVPTRQDVLGFYVVREALESQAARLFAEKATFADRQKLLQSARNLDATYNTCACFAGSYRAPACSDCGTSTWTFTWNWPPARAVRCCTKPSRRTRS